RLLRTQLPRTTLGESFRPCDASLGPFHIRRSSLTGWDEHPDPRLADSMPSRLLPFAEPRLHLRALCGRQIKRLPLLLYRPPREQVTPAVTQLVESRAIGREKPDHVAVQARPTGTLVKHAAAERAPRALLFPTRVRMLRPHEHEPGFRLIGHIPRRRRRRMN